MLSQRDLFDVAIKLFGSLKVIARSIDVHEEELNRYFLDMQELPLSLYSEIHMMIEKEIEAHIENFIQPIYQDFFTLKRVRKNLGLSLSEMAELLGLGGSESSELVRLMENGIVPVLAPISRLVQYLSQTVPDKNSDFLSEFMICQPAEDCSDQQRPAYTMFHTGYPRFIAKPVKTSLLPHGAHSVPIDDIYSLAIGMWIDSPRVVSDNYIHDRLLAAVKALLKNGQAQSKIC